MLLNDVGMYLCPLHIVVYCDGVQHAHGMSGNGTWGERALAVAYLAVLAVRAGLRRAGERNESASSLMKQRL